MAEWDEQRWRSFSLGASVELLEPTAAALSRRLTVRTRVPCLTMPIEASIMDKCQARTTPGESVRRDASHGCICIRQKGQKGSGGVPEACQASSLALVALPCLPAAPSQCFRKDGVQGSASRVATKRTAVDSWDGGKGSWLVDRWAGDDGGGWHNSDESIETRQGPRSSWSSAEDCQICSSIVENRGFTNLG